MASDRYEPKLKLQLLTPLPHLAPGEKVDIRILGYMNSPSDEIPGKIHYVRGIDLERTMTPETTVREIKDFILTTFSCTLSYYQIEIEFGGKNLKDACTIGTLMRKNKFFLNIKCLNLHIIVPGETFKEMYKSFIDMGMPEERALRSTKAFMATVHDTKANHEYKIAERLEKYKMKLLKRGNVRKNASAPTPPQ